MTPFFSGKLPVALPLSIVSFNLRQASRASSGSVGLGLSATALAAR